MLNVSIELNETNLQNDIPYFDHIGGLSDRKYRIEKKKRYINLKQYKNNPKII